MQYGFDSMEPHSHNEMKAFYNRREALEDSGS